MHTHEVFRYPSCYHSAKEDGAQPEQGGFQLPLPAAERVNTDFQRQTGISLLWDVRIKGVQSQGILVESMPTLAA